MKKLSLAHITDFEFKNNFCILFNNSVYIELIFNNILIYHTQTEYRVNIEYPLPTLTSGNHYI